MGCFPHNSFIGTVPVCFVPGLAPSTGWTGPCPNLADAHVLLKTVLESSSGTLMLNLPLLVSVLVALTVQLQDDAECVKVWRAIADISAAPDLRALAPVGGGATSVEGRC